MTLGEPLFPYIPNFLEQFQGYFFLIAGVVGTACVWIVLRRHFPRSILWSIAIGQIITMFLLALNNVDYYPSEYNVIDSLTLAFFLSLPAGLLFGPAMLQTVGRLESPKRLFANIKSIFSEDEHIDALSTKSDAMQAYPSMKVILVNLFIPGIILGSMNSDGFYRSKGPSIF